MAKRKLFDLQIHFLNASIAWADQTQGKIAQLHPSLPHGWWGPKLPQT